MKDKEILSMTSILEQLTNDEFMERKYEVLAKDERYQAAFDRIEKATGSLPIETANEIEIAYCEQLTITQETMYREGFRDGINLILELTGCKLKRKPKYECATYESRRKDADRIHPKAKTGFVYKIMRVISEYTREAEADRDMEALLSRRITEADIVLRGARR